MCVFIIDFNLIFSNLFEKRFDQKLQMQKQQMLFFWLSLHLNKVQLSQMSGNDLNKLHRGN